MFSDDEKTVSALSLFGFDDSDVLSDEVEVWPNNWEAVQLFLAVSGQWRVSMAGRRKKLFGFLRVMEREALSIMGEKKDG